MLRAASRDALLALALLPLVLAPAVVSAQIPAPETYAGDFWTRPRLTGDWGGFRDQMAKRGVALDVDWLRTLQGVMSGGKDQDAGYWGTFEYTLSLDSQKMGLWPGAFLTAYGMSSYGSTVLKDSGALIPVDLPGILPSVAEDEPASALMQLTFAQFLAPWVLGFLWSNKERVALRQDPGNTAALLLQNQFPRLANPGPILRRIIDRFFPALAVPAGPLKTLDDTWSLYYNFDQYLWSPAGAPDKGFGMCAFVRF